jgi:hypothetical protein
MTMRSWIRNLFTRSAARPMRKTLRRARPSLESLEDRLTPTVSNLQITAVESPADVDFGQARHVTVLPGSQVTVDFTYDTDTPGKSLYFTVDLGELGVLENRFIQVDPTDTSTHLSEQITFTIPTTTEPGQSDVALYPRLREDGSSVAFAPGVQVYTPLSNLQITAIHSTADTDGALDQHVTVVPGSQLTVDYTYDGATPGEELQVELFVEGSNGFVSSFESDFQNEFFTGLHHSGQISVTMPTSINPGSDDVVLAISTFPEGRVDTHRPAAITVPSTIVDTSLQVEAPDATYDGQQHGATAIVNPGTALGTISYHYTGSGGYDSDAAPINAGAYHVVATFTPDDASAFRSSTGSADFNIAQAQATIAVTGYDVTYDGAVHSATGTAAGVAVSADTWDDGAAGGNWNGGGGAAGGSWEGGGGASGSAPPTLATAPTRVGLSAYLDLSRTAHTNAGTYTDTWKFHDPNGNYADACGTVSNHIAKAPSTTTATGGQFTYDGHAHAGSGTVDVPGGVVTLYYENIDGPAYSSAMAPIKAGSYRVTATYAGDANHEGSKGTDVLTIQKATLTGDATTQDALNMAKQGKLQITVSNVAGLVNGESIAAALCHAEFYLVIGRGDIGNSGFRRFVFVPTAVTTSGSSITITYSLKDSTLAASLAAALADNTSAATAVSAGFLMVSDNYVLYDDYLARLFSSAK